MQCIFPSTLARPAGWHSQPGAVAGTQQLRWHQEDLVAQSAKRSTLKLLGQTEPFEPVDQIVGQQQQMKVSLVGHEVMRRNLAQVITAFEFADDSFQARSAIVEAPQIQWLQRKIGDEHLIKIMAHLEESQLLAGLFGLGSSHYYIAITLFQSEWLVKELGRRNVSAMMVVAQAGEPLLDGLSQLGSDHKAGLSLFQPSDGLVIVETLVGANNNLFDASGNSGKTSCQQVAHSGPSISVTWAQFPVPEVLRLSFETEQRMIRPASGLERMVTNIGGFLFSVNDQGRGIQIENQTPGSARLDTHPGEKAIVKLAQPRQRLRRHAQEKTSQGGGVGIMRQPAQILKHTVGLQQMRGLDPFETENYRIDDRQQQLADAVAVVPLGQTNLHCHRVLETDPRQETMQQIDAPVMREVFVPKVDGEFSWSFRHRSEPYLIGSFHCNPENLALLCQNRMGLELSC